MIVNVPDMDRVGHGGKLTLAGRIRREDDNLPISLVDFCSRKSAGIIGSQADLSLRYNVSRWENISYPDNAIQERKVLGVIFDGEKAIGFAEFMEWEVLFYLRDRDFLEYMDNHSRRVIDAAMALLSGWPVRKAAEHGRIVEFSRLWMRPSAARGSNWSTVVNAFINQRYRSARKSRASVMLLKPFPLEYEGVFDDSGRVSRSALTLRKAAMQRLYMRTLGARKLLSGEWMWLAMGPGTPAPRKRRIYFDLSD
jgi:hypothetical protein